ncbi:MAG: glycosyltransferase family 2 protein, partial [Candidatus Aureabacteria bacterium]|nr:glycosyltransferase family 2 protein [Candidatus Auribacterota bacterium]
MRKNILAVIPAYNEGENIIPVLDSIRKVAPETDILVVDDGSGDNTKKVSLEHGAFVLRLPVNLGYGAALQAGYKYALKNKYKAVVQLDGDGQHDPRDIKALLDKLENEPVDV